MYQDRESPSQGQQRPLHHRSVAALPGHPLFSQSKSFRSLVLVHAVSFALPWSLQPFSAFWPPLQRSLPIRGTGRSVPTTRRRMPAATFHHASRSRKPSPRTRDSTVVRGACWWSRQMASPSKWCLAMTSPSARLGAPRPRWSLVATISSDVKHGALRPSWNRVRPGDLPPRWTPGISLIVKPADLQPRWSLDKPDGHRPRWNLDRLAGPRPRWNLDKPADLLQQWNLGRHGGPPPT